jgi:hypothetical protein
MLADSNQDRSAPRHPIDPARDPFVGNLSVDDNIREGVRVAIWSAIGDRAREIAAEITDGVVTVAGHYIDDAERAAVHRAIIAVPGVRRIVDRAVPEVADESAAAPVVTYEATPLLQVVRYCGLDDASTAAAIRQAVAELDGVVAALGLEAPDTLIVRYRAPVRDAITLEIGFATVAELAERGHGEVSGSQIPAGPRTHRPRHGGADRRRQRPLGPRRARHLAGTAGLCLPPLDRTRRGRTARGAARGGNAQIPSARWPNLSIDPPPAAVATT